MTPRRRRTSSVSGRLVRILGLGVLIFAVALFAFGRRGVPSSTCRIHGIDVSRHQGEIDWKQVAGAGIRFAWMKATEGGDYLDPTFHRNWELSRAAGLRRGAYHFAYWCRRAEDQAAWFVANVPHDADALPPVLDVEWTPNSRTCAAKVAREKALGDIKIMLAAMEKAYGKRPMIYVPDDLYREVLAGAFEDYPLWVRSLDAPPDSLYGARPWRVWQYSETGSIAGIGGNVDLDCVENRRSLEGTGGGRK